MRQGRNRRLLQRHLQLLRRAQGHRSSSNRSKDSKSSKDSNSNSNTSSNSKRRLRLTAAVAPASLVLATGFRLWVVARSLASKLLLAACNFAAGCGCGSRRPSSTGGRGKVRKPACFHGDHVQQLLLGRTAAARSCSSSFCSSCTPAPAASTGNTQRIRERNKQCHDKSRSKTAAATSCSTPAAEPKRSNRG